MKKEMVMGTIGNTQGVSNMAKPQRIASMISAQRLPPPLPLPPLTVPRVAWSGLAGTCSPPVRLKVNSKCSGAAQNWSLQPLQVISPLTVASGASSLTFWVKTAVSKKTSSPLNDDGSVTCVKAPTGEYPEGESSSRVVGLYLLPVV